jgi:hypothetical protein
MVGDEARRYFGPEDVASLEEALNAAWAAFSTIRCAEVERIRLARHILRRAAEGERDPSQLCDYAVAKTRLHAVWLDLPSTQASGEQPSDFARMQANAIR